MPAMPEFDRYVYTTAPEAYDYRTATTVETFPCPYAGERGKPWRKVRIREKGATLGRVKYLANYQCGRYQSGMNAARFDDPRVPQL